MGTIKYAFRLLHIDNVPHLLKYGFVHGNSKFYNPNYVPIGDSRIIALRNERKIFENYKLGDFIPFYFGPRSPMLYVIQHGYNGVPLLEAECITYAVIRLDDLIMHHVNCVFTDGHALDALTSIYKKERLNDINAILHYSDIYAKVWVNEDDRDLKRRKEAELLLLDDLPPQFIRGFVVYNKNARNKLLTFGVPEEKIVVNPGYYF